jgi:4-amino-4-deoxy-L-arabinose transferase-like glycosyltransferase
MRRYGRALSGILLLLILLASAGVRLWGAKFGLPEYTRFHPDEHALVERAAAILWTGDWNLHRFNYPPFYAYLQAGAYAVYFLWGAAQGLWMQVPPFVLPQYYQVGRLLTAVIGTLTVLAVYLAGRQLRGRRSGVLAAALLGGCYLHIIHSHYATFDAMVALLVLLTWLFSELLRKQPKREWYFLAGLFAGLAGATKYNGAISILMPLLAHALASPWDEWRWLAGRPFLVAGGFCAGFFGGNPFALGNLPDFLNGLATVLHHYSTAQPGFEGVGNWRWYLNAFLSSADRYWVLAAFVGLVSLVWQEWKKGLLLLSFPLVYYLMISRFVVRFERNMVPLLPFLALAAGWLLDWAAHWLRSRAKLENVLIWHSLTAIGAMLLLALPTVASISFDTALSKTDLRVTAGHWINENVPAGSKIAIEHYSVPFDHSRYWVKDIIRISEHDLNWYQQEGFDVLVISDGVWEILRRQPELYPEKMAIYNELISGAELIAEFVPQPPQIVIAGYPTVGVYHFAPVRILAVPK